MLSSEKDFIHKWYKQNCGTFCYVTGNKERRGKFIYYEIIFKSGFKIFAKKWHICNGQVRDLLYDEIVGKEIIMNCGSSLKIIEKNFKEDS